METDEQKARSHPIFQERLRKSVATCKYIGGWLQSHGYRVRIPKTETAPTRDVAWQYSDSGDIFVLINDVGRRVEVKGLTKDFTCKEDWEYPGQFFVCKVRNYKDAIKAGKKPYMFIILNRKKTYAAFIYSVSADSWWEKEHGDKDYQGYRQVSYSCPFRNITWHKIYFGESHGRINL